MKKLSNTAVLLAAAVLSACGGSTFELFPDFKDTSGPTVTASIANFTSFRNSTTHVSSFPAAVTFTADEAATIYYTTNNSDPTTASPSITASANTPISGPSITVSSVLKFFGVDSLANASSITRTTVVSP